MVEHDMVVYCHDNNERILVMVCGGGGSSQSSRVSIATSGVNG